MSIIKIAGEPNWGCQKHPATLKRLPAAFDHEEFIFELKHDGFRALAHATPEAAELVAGRGLYSILS